MEKAAPTFKDFIKAAFKKQDDGSGEITAEQFWAMVVGEEPKGWGLNLSPKQVLSLKSKFEPDAGKHDVITWADFVEVGPDLVKQISSTGRASASRDWCAQFTCDVRFFAHFRCVFCSGAS